MSDTTAAAVQDAHPQFEQRWGHPAPLWMLFITEMWERFSYYGMRALLVFYMTQNFLLGDDRAYEIYGAYTALVYLAPIFGGIAADRVLGYRKGITVGAILMALGHFFMAIQQIDVFYLALALLIVGNGFFKPNMSTIVGRLYTGDDPRRDAGYTIFYVSVNLGAFLSPIVLGMWIVPTFGIHAGFTIAGFGMLAGLIVFLMTNRNLKGISDMPEGARIPLAGLNKEMLVYVAGAVGVAAVWKIVQMHTLVGYALITVGVCVLGYLLIYSFTSEPVVRHRLWVVIVLTSFSLVFWAFFEQAGSSMNLFADRNVGRTFLGWEPHAIIMQSINPLFIMALGLPFATMWILLAKRGLNPSTPLKFGLGIIQLGLGFAAVWYGAMISQDDGIVALGWLVLGYLLQTTGELCLSPVGLSMISRLAPKHMGAMMMGTWYLSFAFASYVAGMIASLMSVGGEGADAGAAVAPTETVMVYGSVFGQIAMVAAAVGLFVTVVSPLIRRGMHGVH